MLLLSALFALATVAAANVIRAPAGTVIAVSNHQNVGASIWMAGLSAIDTSTGDSSLSTNIFNLQAFGQVDPECDSAVDIGTGVGGGLNFFVPNATSINPLKVSLDTVHYDGHGGTPTISSVMANISANTAGASYNWGNGLVGTVAIDNNGIYYQQFNPMNGVAGQMIRISVPGSIGIEKCVTGFDNSGNFYFVPVDQTTPQWVSNLAVVNTNGGTAAVYLNTTFMFHALEFDRVTNVMYTIGSPASSTRRLRGTPGTGNDVYTVATLTTSSITPVCNLPTGMVFDLQGHGGYHIYNGYVYAFGQPSDLSSWNIVVIDLTNCQTITNAKITYSTFLDPSMPFWRPIPLL